jgi:purine-binding chemotaxis protein CheW
MASRPPPEAPAAPPAAERDALADFFWREDEEVDGLPAAAPAAATPGEEDQQGTSEWLSFLLGGEEYALAIGQVREVLKARAVTEVPRAPEDVLGVIIVRGEVIAVFDLRRRLGLPAAQLGRSSRILVCDMGDGPRGLLVDAVRQVVRLRPSEVEQRPPGVGGAAADLIVGIGREGGGLYVLLDLAALLGPPPAAQAPGEGL